jgi:DNA-binding beta-propeller fold protein YncE
MDPLLLSGVPLETKMVSYPVPIGIDEDDAKQNVYVTDLGNNRVQRFTNNGIFVSTWGMIGSEAGQFNNPGRIAVDPSGNLFVAYLVTHVFKNLMLMVK